MQLLFLIVAIVLFLLAAFGVGTIGPVAVVPLGLAFFAAAHISGLGVVLPTRRG